ncbi:MAG: hypothetical protein AB7I41_21860 [Candidatus Sericytochromatia bacterium]
MSEFSAQISADMDVLLTLSDRMLQSELFEEAVSDPYEKLLRLEVEREKILQFLPQPMALSPRLQGHFLHMLALEELQKEFADKRQALTAQYQSDQSSLRLALADLELRRKARLAEFDAPSLTLEEQKALLNHLLWHAVNAYFDNALEKSKLALLTA